MSAPEKKEDGKKEERKIDGGPQAKEKKEDKKEKKEDKKEEDKEQPAARIFVPKSVVVHPLVMLSVTDHYTRSTAKDSDRRVVGILLGESHLGKVDITNSYAVPFEEDPRDAAVWHLDHNYHEEMFAMFKKVNAREKVVGWYSTGPKIRPNDIDINELVRRYCPHPILVIVDVNPRDDLEIPTTAFLAVETKPEEKSTSRETFVHLVCEIGAHEAEEVGVEHLLRNIRDNTGGTMSDAVVAKLNSLRGLRKRMEEMAQYLDNCCSGRIPQPNHAILYQIQDLLNLRPDLDVQDLVTAFNIKSNDHMMVIYLSSLIRSIIALHSLLNNKLSNRAWEAEKKEAALATAAERADRADRAAQAARDATAAASAASAAANAKQEPKKEEEKKKES